ncbi:tetratricopeptide repeat protein [Pseudomonadota bacterium]|nr:tetratricopeptide repeat protein [Pseudomonadota bacterium]
MLTKLSLDQSLMKARSNAKKGNFAEAKNLYQTVLKIFPKNQRAQQGLASLNKHNQNNPLQNPPQEVINQLVNLYNQGQLSSVVEQAQALTEQYPKTLLVWNILGASAAQIGMLDEAIVSYNKVLSLKPDFYEAYNNMGITLQNQGNVDKALEAYNKAILLKPDYAEAYYNLGNVLQDQGKLDKAVDGLQAIYITEA